MVNIVLTGDNVGEAVRLAGSVLDRGGIIAYPTETFYGLGARYDNEPALQRLYELKRRPRDKAMPLIIGSAEQLYLLAGKVSAAAWELIHAYWPGPLTLVLEARRGLSGYVTAEHKVAVRMPGESFALRLARAYALPITATSANVSGAPPSVDASMIRDYFDDALELVIDASAAGSTAPSTIVDVTGERPKVLRQGALALRL